MPLVHEALSIINDNIFSIENFKNEFEKIAEFSMPTAAVISLLKRAQSKHKLLKLEERGFYKILRNNLNDGIWSQIRDGEQRKYRKLAQEFTKFCMDKYKLDIEHESLPNYFFEILHEIAPTLFNNLKEIESINHTESDRKKSS